MGGLDDLEPRVDFELSSGIAVGMVFEGWLLVSKRYAGS